MFLLKDHEDPPSQRLHAQHTISAGFQAVMPSSAKAMERRLSDLSIGHALKSVLLRYWFLLFLQTNGSGPMNHWQEVRPFISGGPLLCAPLKKIELHSVQCKCIFKMPWSIERSRTLLSEGDCISHRQYRSSVYLADYI